MSRRRIAIAAGVVCAVAAIAYLVGRRAGSRSGVARPAAGEPTLRVKAVAIRAGHLQRRIALFGAAASLSQSVHAYTLAFEVRLLRFHVASGQHVVKHAPLFDIRRSPAAAVAADAARAVLREAEKRMRQAAARREQGLATEDQLIQAQGALKRAKQKVSSMRQAGQLVDRHTARSLRPGVVSRLNVQPGSIVAPATAIVSVTEDASIGVALWAAPTQARSIAPRMAVAIRMLGARGGDPVSGRVLRVDDRVDRLKRLVRVSVSVDRPGRLALGQAVRGELTVDSPRGLIVPRAALVAGTGRLQVFTIEHGRARAHTVHELVEHGRDVLIRADHIRPGQRVITLGAYQAEDGMRAELVR